MPTIIPIKDMRDTNALSEMCHKSADPIFVTKNGYGDMVVMSLEAYENQVGRLRIRDAILMGKSQNDDGEVLNGKEAMKALKKKYANKV